MADLFVIEAPFKAQLLEKILRELHIDARVQATRGHFMSMPGKLRPLGIDSRMREFMWVPANPEIFMRLRDMARAADNLYIATDADQEGDVIAWDVYEAVRDIHPSPARVRLKSMDSASIREAIALAVPVEKAAAVPGRARGIIDRMIGGVFGSPEVPAGRVSTAILGLVGSRKPSVMKVRLAAPSKDRGRPWLAEFDLVAPLDLPAAERLAKLDLPPLGSRGAPLVHATRPSHTGDILVRAGARFDLSPTEAAESLQRSYEAGRMSYPRAGSRGVTPETAKQIANIFRKSGWAAVKAENFGPKGGVETHEAPHPIGQVDPRLKPERLTQDEGVRTLVAADLVKAGMEHKRETAFAQDLAPFLRAQGFPGETDDFIAGLRPDRDGATVTWHREHGPAYPGQEVWARSVIERRRPDTVLLEAIVKAGLGRPSTWHRHVATFMGRGLAADDLKLTPKGLAWVEGSYPPLLDPRLSAAIEVACERVDPSLFDDPDREPWEVMVDQIVNLLPRLYGIGSERPWRTSLRARRSTGSRSSTPDPISWTASRSSSVDRSTLRTSEQRRHGTALPRHNEWKRGLDSCPVPAFGSGLGRSRAAKNAAPGGMLASKVASSAADPTSPPQTSLTLGSVCGCSVGLSLIAARPG